MSQTSLHSGPPKEAALAAYNGVEMPESYGNPASELRALRTGCGVFDLAWRALIKATGKDRVRWLHNMVTNNVRDLAPNRGCYAFVLNAQGRILGDLNIFKLGESLLLETDKRQAESLLTTLKRYIIMDKVELNDSGEARTAIGICGPKAAGALEACGLSVAGMEPLEIREASADGVPVMVIRGPEQKPNWYELWVDHGQTQAIREKLASAGAVPVGAQALEMWRVLHGIPQYGQDIRDRDLPQETGQMHALSFTKGCYIGQEIVERIRSRGQVHRKFTGFEFSGEPPAAGKFDAEGRTLAEITTVIAVPTDAGERKIGLGYIRLDAVSAGAQVDMGGHTARIVDLPFEI